MNDRDRPMSHRNFRLLLGARATDMLGNAVAPIALAFAVLDLTGSATDLGVVVGARSIANVAVLLFGGVLADRFSPSVVLVWSNIASGLTQAVIAALVLTGQANIPLLAALSMLNGAAAAVSFPAAQAMVPRTVPKTLLSPANALNRLAINSAAAGGAALGGILVAAIGPGWGLGADAVSFLLTAVLFSRIDLPPLTPAVGKATATVWGDLQEGWAAFTSHTWIWVVVASFAAINAAWVGASHVLGPTVADATIGRAGWGIVLGTLTVGLVCGALLAMRWQPCRPLRAGMLCAMLLAAIPAALANLPVLPALVAAAFIAGLALEVFAVAWDTSLQSAIEPERLARVYAWDALGSFLAIPVGEISVGPLAERFGLTNTLNGLAGLIILASTAALASGSVRTHSIKDYPLPQRHSDADCPSNRGPQ